MRWMQPRPKTSVFRGDTKIKIKFLLFPRTIDYETRWLERASWEEAYLGGWTGWLPIRWLN